jgi:hypothetical protein
MRSRKGRPAAEKASTSGDRAESRASITTGRGSIPQVAAFSTVCTAAPSPAVPSSSSGMAARSRVRLSSSQPFPMDSCQLTGTAATSEPSQRP